MSNIRGGIKIQVMGKKIIGLLIPDISVRHFSTDISSQGLFDKRIFWHLDILAWVFFSTRDVSAWGCYGIWTFWHICLCQNVYIALHGAKIYYCVKMFQCHFQCTWYYIQYLFLSQLNTMLQTMVAAEQFSCCINLALCKCDRLK